MRSAILTVLSAGFIVSCGLTAQAGDSHPVAQPYGGAFEVGEPSYAVERERAAIPIDHLVLGTEHILDQQHDVRLVILDNLSALCGGAENDAESWQSMQDFILRLRRRGLAVLFAHHSGKGGLQRGWLADDLDAQQGNQSVGSACADGG